MTPFNWPLFMVFVAGAIFWIALLVGLWHSADCSVARPC